MSASPEPKRARATQEADGDAASVSKAEVLETAARLASIAAAKFDNAASLRAANGNTETDELYAEAVAKAAEAKAFAARVFAEAEAEARAAAQGHTEPPRRAWDRHLNEDRKAMAAWVANNMPPLTPEAAAKLIDCGEYAMEESGEYSAAYAGAFSDWVEEHAPKPLDPFWQRVMDAWMLVDAVEDAVSKAGDNA